MDRLVGLELWLYLTKKIQRKLFLISFMPPRSPQRSAIHRNKNPLPPPVSLNEQSDDEVLQVPRQVMPFTEMSLSETEFVDRKFFRNIE